MHSQTLDLDFSVKEALKTGTFWMLTAAISLRLFVTIALNAHLIPILVWRGVSESAAAYFVSLFALGTIITTLGMGWIGDRWRKSLLCSMGIIPIIVAMLGLTFSQSRIFVYFFPISLALIMGIAALNWALIGDLFGRRSYANLRGIMAVVYGLASFFSPIYAGWVYDRNESYTIVLITFSVILMVAVLIFAVLPLVPFRRLK